MRLRYQQRFRLISLAYILLFGLLSVAEYWSIQQSGYYITSIFIAIALAILAYSFLYYTETTFRKIDAFFQSALHDDFSQQAGDYTYSKSLQNNINAVNTQLKSKRLEQQSENSFLRALIRQAPVAIFSYDTMDRITLFNQAASRLFEIASPSVLGDLDQQIKNFSQILKEIKPGSRILRKSHREGVEISFVISTTGMRSGNQLQTLVTMENIGREIMEAEYTAWRNLISVLTHEVMNSVTPIVSLASTSRDILSQNDLLQMPHEQLAEELSDAAQALQTIANRSEGIMGFVDGYRKMSKIPKPEFELVPVELLLSEATLLQKNLLNDRNIALRINVSPETLTIGADKQQLEQILINLIKNAVDACNESLQPKIEIISELRGSRTIIAITDNGCGIEEEVLTQIFVPFYTTKRHGTGIGMALTRQIMHAHGGEVSVKSTPGIGTTVELLF